MSGHNTCSRRNRSDEVAIVVGGAKHRDCPVRQRGLPVSVSGVAGCGAPKGGVRDSARARGRESRRRGEIAVTLDTILNSFCLVSDQAFANHGDPWRVGMTHGSH